MTFFLFTNFSLFTFVPFTKHSAELVCLLSTERKTCFCFDFLNFPRYFWILVKLSDKEKLSLSYFNFVVNVKLIAKYQITERLPEMKNRGSRVSR